MNHHCSICNLKLKKAIFYGEYKSEQGNFCSEKHLKQWIRKMIKEGIKYPSPEQEELCFNCGKTVKVEEGFTHYYIEIPLSSGYFCSDDCLRLWSNSPSIDIKVENLRS